MQAGCMREGLEMWAGRGWLHEWGQGAGYAGWMHWGEPGDAGWEKLRRHISRSGRGNWEVLEMESGGDACRGTGGDA